ALGHQLVHHLREIIRQYAVARGQEAVRVLALRHALAVLRAVGELVALDQRDALEVVREGARSAQPGHAAAENNRMPSCYCHGSSVTGFTPAAVRRMVRSRARELR